MQIRKLLLILIGPFCFSQTNDTIPNLIHITDEAVITFSESYITEHIEVIKKSDGCFEYTGTDLEAIEMLWNKIETNHRDFEKMNDLRWKEYERLKEFVSKTVNYINTVPDINRTIKNKNWRELYKLLNQNGYR